MTKISIFEFLKFPFRVSKKYAFWSIFDVLFSGFFPIINVYAFSAMLSAVLSKTDVVMPVIVYLSVIGADHIYSSIYKFMVVPEELKIQEKVDFLYIDKIGTIKYDYIENPDYYDEISVLKTQLFGKFLAYHRSLLYSVKIFLNLFSVVAIIVYIAGIKGIVVVVTAVPMLYIIHLNGKRNYQLNEQLAYKERYADYLDQVLVGKDFAYERGLFGYFPAISKMWKSRSIEILKLRLKTSIFNAFNLEFASIFMGFVFFFVMIEMVKASAGSGVSVLIPAINQIVKFLNVLRWELNGVLKDYVDTKNYLKKLDDFLKLEDHLLPDSSEGMENQIVENIEFKNVSFTYPGTDRQVLSDLSFKLEAGKKYVLVGENGSGKSTILKLMLSLFTNYEGEILVNGRPIKEYAHSPFAVVFQDFAKFFLDLDDNLRLGRQNISDYNINKVKTDFQLDNLPHGVTLRTGGDSNIDLSGGQWQRLAVARALCAGSSAVIMDEPNSAMDAHQESNLYSQFADIERDKLSLMISHRLAVSKLADELLVLENGRLKERGSHLELMSRDGIYKRMYDSQRGLYAGDI